ncbi:MAG: glycosyltransferase [Propionibacteriaceae bacterium]
MAGTEEAFVAVVIAAFNPDATLLDNARAAAAQAVGVVVVDDGSAPDSGDVFAALLTEGVVVHHQSSNTGIAAALNAGVAVARQRWDPTHILTLDQDSTVAPTYVRHALETEEAATAAGLKVGFVSAGAYGQQATPSRGTIAGFTRAFDPLQSGFVVPVATLDAVGMFDEGLFIDGVDSEFTARVRAAGLEVLVGTGCQLEHALGKREPAVLFGRPLRLMGRPITYNYHSPSRVYYISRNGATLAARYLRTDPVWVARRSVEELKAHTLRIGLGRDKAKLLLAAVSGIGDAFRHRTGRLTDDMARKFSGQQSSS